MEHLSNEKKATEIAMCHFPMHETADAESVRFGALQMAQWKDEQEIEFLQSLMFQSATYHIFDKINERIKLLKGK